MTTHSQNGREAGDGTSAALLVTTPRTPGELRAAQLVVAGHVANDATLETEWQREWTLIELLECLGLFRRI